jgi:uncharacterized OsmC-like protein
MKFSAKVENHKYHHEVSLRTGESQKSISIPPEPEGFGSSASGAEILLLALATCYCNDIYREAKKRGLEIDGVEVEVEGEFNAKGAPTTGVKYHARVRSKASKGEIQDLMVATDKVAEIQNTLRVGTPVELESIESIT